MNVISRSVRGIVPVALVAGLLLAIAPASAQHRPSNYCSPSGDICQSTRRIEGKRRLSIATIEKYFEKYRLCVLAPDDTKKCREFKMNKSGPVWASSIKWSRYFPNKGAGAYTVKWKAGGAQVGKRLGFHVRN